MASIRGGAKNVTTLAHSARVVPTLRISLRTSPWAMLALVLALAFSVHVLLPSYISGAILNPMGMVAATAAVGGIRRGVHTTAFNLIAGGVVVFAIADGVALVSPVPELDAFVAGLFIVAYAAFACGLAYLFAESRRA